MTELQEKTSDYELSPGEMEIVRWQEEPPDAGGDQDENGVDLARLRENLKLTPAQRLQEMDKGRLLMGWIQNARIAANRS